MQYFTFAKLRRDISNLFLKNDIKSFKFDTMSDFDTKTAKYLNISSKIYVCGKCEGCRFLPKMQQVLILREEGRSDNARSSPKNKKSPKAFL